MIPRHWRWWSILLVSANNITLSLWLFIHDHHRWHIGIAVVMVLTTVMALYQLHQTEGTTMTWYWAKWWRFALSAARKGVMLDADGRWVHALGPLWVRTDGPAKCIHNVVAAVGGYPGGDHLHCLDCDTDLTTGKKLGGSE
jgi:hypothetical protein